MLAERFRPDIQGLRAIAVLAVLAYHVWPISLPGGFVGVDVFFVISGYLITGVLLADVESAGRIALGRFYARRIKRLLPAATCVLIAIALAIPLLPAGRRAETAIELAASALYVQNHWLAHRARDYLAADDAPSIVQHYWSLSVEEQYYIAWPLLLGLAALLWPSHRARPRVSFGALLALLLAGSLVYSVWLTARDASQAYFATSTRAWELAIGGALTIFMRAPIASRATRTALAWSGLGGIVAACALFDASTPFPGYAALLPTLAAGAIIAAGTSGAPWSGDRLLAHPVMQYLGGISYSLYLWHWPVIVLVDAQAQGDATDLQRGLAALGAVALAHVTKRFVEDPCRAADFAGARAWQPFAFAGGCLALSLIAAVGVHAAAGPTEAWTEAKGGARGARALEQPGYDFRRERIDTITPPLAQAKNDVASAYSENCFQNVTERRVKVCSYGPPDAELEIAVVGDSHAVHWLPAFQALAQRRRVRILGIAKNACALSLTPVRHGDRGRTYTECTSWSKAVIAWLADHDPDVVLIAQSPRYSEGAGSQADRERVAAGMADAWRKISANGLRVLAIAPTPWLPSKNQPSDCLAVARDWVKECSFAAADVLLPNAIATAAATTGTPLIDVNDAFCIDGTCPPIVGGVLIYRDNQHVTATYARSLAERFQRELAQLGIELPSS